MKPVAIRGRKWDGSSCHSVDGFLLEADTERIVCYCPPGRVITRREQCWTLEESRIYTFFPERWFNCLQVRSYFYLDIITPPIFDGRRLSYVDLDLDLVAIQDEVQLLDEDEWVLHCTRYNYPATLKAQVWQAVGEALDWLEINAPTFHAETAELRARGDRLYSSRAQLLGGPP